MITTLLLLCFVVWSVFESMNKPKIQQQSVAESPLVESNAEDQAAKIAVDRWGVSISQSNTYEVAVGESFSFMAYGTDSENVKLFLPEFDGKFTCEVDGSETHKAVFATLAEFKGDISGPYAPEKVVDLNGKKYALFKAGMNCYDQESAALINNFYNDYVVHFKVEPL